MENEKKSQSTIPTITKTISDSQELIYDQLTEEHKNLLISKKLQSILELCSQVYVEAQRLGNHNTYIDTLILDLLYNNLARLLLEVSKW